MMIAATIIHPTGEVESVLLPPDSDERLSRLRYLVGGCIEGIPLPCGRYMILNENAKEGPHLINQTATDLAHEAGSIQKSDYIAGVAVVLPAEMLG